MSDNTSKKVRMPIEAPSPDKENVRHYSGNSGNSGNRQRNFAFRKYNGFEDNVRRGDEQRRFNRNRRGNGDHDYYSKRQSDYGRRKEDQATYERRHAKVERIPVHTRIVKMKTSVHTSKSAPSDVSTTCLTATNSKLTDTPQKINRPDKKYERRRDKVERIPVQIRIVKMEDIVHESRRTKNRRDYEILCHAENSRSKEKRHAKVERIPVQTRIVNMKASVHTPKSAPSDVSTTRFAARTSKLMETPQKINKPDRTIKVKPRYVKVSKDPKSTSLRLRNLNDSKRPIDLVDVSSDDEIEAACVPINAKEDPSVPTMLLQSMTLSPKEVITPQPSVLPPTINFAALVAEVSDDNRIAVIPPSITDFVESVCEAPKNEMIQEKEPLVGTQPTVVPPTINFATLVANVPLSNDIQVAVIPPSICEAPKNEMIQEKDMKPRDVNVFKDPKMIKRTSLRLRNLNDSKRLNDLVDVSSDDEIEAACVPIKAKEDPLVPTMLLQSMTLSPKEVITPQPAVLPPTINFATLAAEVPASVIPPSITEHVELMCEAPKNEMMIQEKELLVGSQPTVVPPTINFGTLVANVPLSNDIQIAVNPPSICETPMNKMIQETESLTHIGTDHCSKLSSLSGGGLHANCDQLKVEAPFTTTPTINFASLGTKSNGEAINSEMIQYKNSQVDAQIDTSKSTNLSGGFSKFVCEQPKEIPVSTLPTINFSLLAEPIKSVEKVASSPIGSFPKTDISAPIKSSESTLSPLTTTVESVKKRPMLQVDEPSPHVKFVFNHTPILSNAWNSFGDGLNVKLLGDKEPVLRKEKTEFEPVAKRRKLAKEEPSLLQVEYNAKVKPVVTPNPNSSGDGEKVVLPTFDFSNLLPDARMAVPIAQHQVQEIPAVLPVVSEIFAPPPTVLDTLVPNYQFALPMPTLDQQE